MATPFTYSLQGVSGFSGISGFSGVGLSGTSGYSGLGTSGYSGYSGYSGLNGAYAASGISGFSGPSGYSGVGVSGYSGISGYSGYSGSGVSGYSGLGISGYSGYSGISGYSGWSGISGYSGFSGYSGISGFSSTSGFSGISGYSGWSGISGYSGASGYSGISGYSGVGTSGYSGATGTSGYSGYSGNSTSGYSGYSGLSGYSSTSGFSGYSGFSGSGISGYSGSGVSGYSGYSGAPAVGATYYPTSTPSEFSVYYGLMSLTPAVGTEYVYAYTLSASEQFGTLGQMVTPVGSPGEMVIAPGTWTFNAYYTLSGSNTSSITLTHAIYDRNGTTETMLFSATGAYLTASNTPILQSTSYSIAQSIPLSASTDRLVYRVFASTAAGDSATVGFAFLGTQHYSNIQTGIYQGAVGTSGYSGYSGLGLSGYSGISGYSGNIGQSGYSGISGYSGFGNTVVQVSQTSHGFSAGQVIARNSSGSNYVLAEADSSADAEAIGIVQTVSDANTFVYVSYGYISGLSGLTDGTVYFLSPTSAGTLTSTAPVTVGQVSKPMLIATSTTSGVVVNMRGITIASSYGTMSSQNANNVTITGGSISGTTISLANAYTAGAPTATGYINIKDSSGTTYKMLVGT